MGSSPTSGTNRLAIAPGIAARFGGNGADGCLVVTQGTVTVDTSARRGGFDDTSITIAAGTELRLLGAWRRPAWGSIPFSYCTECCATPTSTVTTRALADRHGMLVVAPRFVSPDDVQLVVLDAGSATWPMPISVSSLLGLAFYQQMAIVEPGASPAGMILSDGLANVIGAQRARSPAVRHRRPDARRRRPHGPGNRQRMAAEALTSCASPRDRRPDAGGIRMVPTGCRRSSSPCRSW